MAYYWLSFIDDQRPEGQQFLGGCIVVASNIKEAITRAWQLNINPGGEVVGFAVPPMLEDNIPRFGIDRLLSKAELNALGEFSKYDREKGAVWPSKKNH